MRARIVRQLEQHLGLAFDRPDDRTTCLENEGGDALDAVIMAVTASRTRSESLTEARDGYVLEPSGGWIFTGA